jgi:cytochrome c
MKASKWLMIPAAAAVLFVSTQATADLALAKKSGCLACHSVDKKIVGPAWKDVAARYKGDAGAKASLIAKVKKGGKGNWTKVTHGAPMPPYSPRVSDENISKLVDFIIAL